MINFQGCRERLVLLRDVGRRGPVGHVDVTVGCAKSGNWDVVGRLGELRRWGERPSVRLRLAVPKADPDPQGSRIPGITRSAKAQLYVSGLQGGDHGIG